jgi:hypothetical protein
MFFVAFHDLLLGELAISVLVKSLEYFREVLLLFLAEELTGNEGISSLLQLLVSSKGLQVSEGALDKRVVNLGLTHLNDPWVLKSLLG